MKNRFFAITLAILTMGLLVTSNIWAQDGPQAQPQAQPQPQTAVARISVIHGNVTTMRGDAGQWVAATVNTPMVPGDAVGTADQSRAEVQLDFANIMQLDQHTEAKVADLEQNKIQIQLASGLVDYAVYRGTQADAEIDTPNMGVHPLGPGIYRIQVNSDSETQLIVRQGEAEVLTNQGSTKVEAGQSIQIHGTDNPEYKVDQAPGGDDFDRWCGDRDRQVQSAQASQHTDPSYMGSSDLDTYGQWSEVPDQGWCWTPQVDMGWVPYTAGRWGWEPYWGWTWISYEPWGWVPYHYGSWFMYGGRWRWRPDRGGWGSRGGNYSGNRWGSPNGAHFLPRGGGLSGRPGGNMPNFGGRSNSMAPGRMGTGQAGAGGSSYNWQGVGRGNQSGRWPAAVNGPSTGFRSSTAPQGGQNNWQRFASPSPYGGRMGSGETSQRGGWQGYSSAPRNYSGGSRGWNAPAPRSGGSYNGGGSRPPLQLNRPIMRQRAPSGGYYGGGRSYSAPSGGGRSYSAPSGGGGRSYSAPSGGGRSYSAPRSGGGGGGGGHSSGGGSHGGGHR
ncbi:MAG: DUF6600 domain-containing protein [Terriglobia bacterium]